MIYGQYQTKMEASEASLRSENFGGIGRCRANCGIPGFHLRTKIENITDERPWPDAPLSAKCVTKQMCSASTIRRR